MNDKQFEKVVKAIGQETQEELDSLSVEELKARIVQSTQSVIIAKTERDANPNYQQAKEDKKVFDDGFREIKSRQNAIVDYAIHLLDEKGAGFPGGKSSSKDFQEGNEQ